MRLNPHARAQKPTTCHIVREGWSVPLGQLLDWDVPARMAAVRTDLYRAGAADADGWLFLALHGAYDPATGTYPLHVHGYGSRSLMDCVDRLRDRPMYRPAVASDGRDAARTPIRIDRKPLAYMPDPLTYVLKSMWFLRETYLADDGLRSAFGGPRRAITEPAYSEHLRFLDQWRLEDLTMLIHMGVTKEGLITR